MVLRDCYSYKSKLQSSNLPAGRQVISNQVQNSNDKIFSVWILSLIWHNLDFKNWNLFGI